MNWIPLDKYHQRPKENEIVSLSDGKIIWHDIIWINEFEILKRKVVSGWYHIDGENPLDIKPTHYLKLELPR